MQRQVQGHVHPGAAQEISRAGPSAGPRTFLARLKRFHVQGQVQGHVHSWRSLRDFTCRAKCRAAYIPGAA